MTERNGKGMQALFLYGVNCTKQIWNRLLPLLPTWHIDIVSYPHAVTEQATCVSDLTRWVSERIKGKRYDVVVGHSLGGLIALGSAFSSALDMDTQIVCLDTNLKPAGAFFRNLMTPEHTKQYGAQIQDMMEQERRHYTPALMQSIRDGFDYTDLLLQIKNPVHLLMGDRGRADAEEHIGELHLSDAALAKLQIRFVPDSCHLPMIEDPEKLADILNQICRRG